MTLTYRIILFFALQVVINAPLVSLKGLLTLLNDNTLSEMQVKELFPKLIQDVGYTSDLLESLLQWAKTQLQGIHSNPKKIPLQPLISDNIALLSNTEAQKKITLTQEIVEDVMVFADEDMLRTI